jgi:hypothetical protein
MRCASGRSDGSDSGSTGTATQSNWTPRTNCWGCAAPARTVRPRGFRRGAGARYLARAEEARRAGFHAVAGGGHEVVGGAAVGAAVRHEVAGGAAVGAAVQHGVVGGAAVGAAVRHEVVGGAAVGAAVAGC